MGPPTKIPTKICIEKPLKKHGLGNLERGDLSCDPDVIRTPTSCNLCRDRDLDW
jgi:hypothetical protein